MAGCIYDIPILLNPQLIIYSAALGGTVLTVRIASCFLCGITAGLLLHFLYRDKPFFNFSGLERQSVSISLKADSESPQQ